MNKDRTCLELKSIHKVYRQGKKQIEVLKDINLNLYTGKWYTVFGVSGSGKTTLLNILGGLEKPDRGAIEYNGRDIYSLKDKKLSNWRNKKIGFVFQFFHLMGELNVKKNILLPVSIKNNDYDRTWFDRIIDLLDIGDLLNRQPATLSGGEKQRVAIARALINKPDFILADEPTGNLDSKNSKMVVKLLENLKSESEVGIILATHEHNLTGKDDKKLLIEEGQVQIDKKE
ncbi:MAG: ABC transporter ATP-binding protein [Elusimicrobiota bacterium]